MKLIDVTGQKFNLLLAKERVIDYNGIGKWLCICDCGNTTLVNLSKLKSGHTKSCGCINKKACSDRASEMHKRNIKYTPEIASARRIWKKRYSDGCSFEDFHRLSQENCHYCNSPPSNKQNSAVYDQKSSELAKNTGTFIYNGLDRIDSSKCHTIENIVTCCKYCNYAKRERSLHEFISWAHNLYDKLCKTK